MSDRVAPRIATWLLACLLPRADREAVLGDLVEEYALRVQSTSSSRALWWYWGQACRSIPLMLWSSVRRYATLSTLAVAVAMYVAAGLLEFASTVAIAQLLDPHARAFTVLSVIVGLATMGLAGYTAAWIRSGAANVLAAIILIGVALLMVTRSGGAPLWYALIFLIVGPLAALAGGALRAGRTGRVP